MLLETPICDFDFDAPKFELKDFSGKVYTLDDIRGKNGTLVAFICNHCPYVKAIVDRFVDDVKVLQKNGFGVVAIMSNNCEEYPEDSPEKMKEFTLKNGFSFPYLIDDTQEIAKKYNAVCTPDFFGFDRELKLGYRGRLDNLDISTHEPRERIPELLNAMLNINDTEVDNQIPSMGCSIKWKS
ncbi:MAG: Thiol-disulfide oxidoreductase ResA [uncultured Campylobacterales bacterium]|uniref:Thiol-disulfide oxidoreductase ResA n=1 Tax=uncultured Campylobacterales bacterium TaxID=352960 RepID=A0A6S6S2A7_9BACT|nr:MAG: Thiol-disulfide oxidoreductase ResA [uncultured Campylobacterales bacterium]